MSLAPKINDAGKPDASLLHVVIPAYGESPFLIDAIQSAISSVSASTSITVLDDASPSDTVKAIADRFAPRVTYLRNELNLGLAANFLHSFEISTGKFTIVLGSDDQMLPGYEDQLSSTCDRFPEVSVVHPLVRVIDERGNEVFPLVDKIKEKIRGQIDPTELLSGEAMCRKLFIGNFMYFPATAWRTEVMRSANWDTTYKHAVDMDLLFKLAISGNQFAFTDDHVFNYRRHAASVSSVLAAEDTRLDEEVAVHWTARKMLPEGTKYSTKLLAQTAPTIRIHATIIGFKQLAKNPGKALRHIIRALMPIRPLK